MRRFAQCILSRIALFSLLILNGMPDVLKRLEGTAEAEGRLTFLSDIAFFSCAKPETCAKLPPRAAA